MDLYIASLTSSNVSISGDDGQPNIKLEVTGYTTISVTKALSNVLFCTSCATLITNGDISVQLTNSSGRILTATEMASLQYGTMFDMDDDGIPDEAENLNFISKTAIAFAASPYTVLARDTLVEVDASGGAVAITLPAGLDGQVYEIKDGEGSAATNNITITPDGTETIGGAATNVISTNYGSVKFYYDETTTDWKVIVSVEQSLAPGSSPTFDSIATNGTGNVSLVQAAQVAGAGTTGAGMEAAAGAGSIAAGGVAAADGGRANFTGGAGGASDGTDAAAGGGSTSITGGAGGAASGAIAASGGGALNLRGGDGGAGSAGAAGAAGANAILNAGAGGADGGGGAGTDGTVLIGAANSLAITIGNATDDPAINVLGAGNISMLGGGEILNSRLVQVVITATGGAAGATAGALSVQVNDLAGNAIGRAVQLRLDIADTDMAGPLDAAGTCQFDTASTGAYVVGGAGGAAAIVTTDATGLFVSTTANAVDETNYFSATTAAGGFATAAGGCAVVDCQSDAATWSA